MHKKQGTSGTMAATRTLLLPAAALIVTAAAAARADGARPAPGARLAACRWSAGLRALESERLDCAFHDPLARALARGVPYREEARPPRGQVGPVVARAMMIDAAVARATRAAHGPKQVVLLGAGCDTRAQRLRHLPGVRFFEVDGAAALRRRRWLLGRAEPRDAGRACLDLGRRPERLLPRLARCGHARTAPTVWVAEGALTQLPPGSARALLDALPAEPPGSRVVCAVPNRRMRTPPRGAARALLARASPSARALLGACATDAQQLREQLPPHWRVASAARTFTRGGLRRYGLLDRRAGVARVHRAGGLARAVRRGGTEVVLELTPARRA